MIRLLLLLGLLAFRTACAAPAPVDAAAPLDWPLSLTASLGVLEDPSRSLGIDEVRSPAQVGLFAPAPQAGPALNYGYSRSAFWLRLTLANPGPAPLERMLEIASSPLGDVAFHWPDPDGRYAAVTTGMRQPFASRAFPNRNYVFPLTLPPKSETVAYLRIESTNPTVIPARLWAPDEFHRAERNDYMVQALYYGVVLAMVVFNLILWIALKDVMYLLYVNFLFWFSLTVASQSGLARQFLWPDIGHLAEIFTTCCMSLTLASLMIFMRRMLELRRVAPRLDRIAQGYIALLVLVIAGCLIDYPRVIAAIGHAIAIGAVFTLGISILRSLKGQRAAYYFILAFATLITFAVITVLRNNGILPANAFTNNAIQIGSPIEMMLLAFALADRFIHMRKEKDAAQAAQLSAEQRLVETLKRSEAELEQRVADRTRDLANANQRLRESEELLRNIAHHDALTGLANRLLFQAHLGQALKRAQRTGESLALLMIDLDGFKPVNDRYGHDAGDHLLQEIANRLAAGVRESDLVARLGGDEFVAVLESAGNAEDALQIGDKLVAEIGQPIVLAGGETVTVGASIGIALARPEDSPETLMHLADQAMYAAKSSGKNHCRLAESVKAD